MLRERFVKTAELSLFALTTGMPRRDAARIFYQVCGALLALAYPGIPCHETPYALLRTTPVHTVGASLHSHVLSCAVPHALPFLSPVCILDKAMPGCLPAFQG